jgi:alpha-tubulin suppressor-like RCC1 family protein
MHCVASDPGGHKASDSTWRNCVVDALSRPTRRLAALALTVLSCKSDKTARIVATPLTFASVTAGVAYSCGTTAGGAVYCWGYNVHGGVGDGTTTDRSLPTAVIP